VTLAKIQAVYDAMTARGLSGSTVRCLHDVVRMSLAAAVRQGLIARNPALDVLLPAKTRRIPKHWSGDEVRRFLSSVAGEPDAAQWMMLLYTGMRIGELLALRWQDVDLVSGTARIVRTVTVDRDGREVIAEGAKSRASNRTVPLVGPCLAALKAHQAALKARRLKAGPAWVEEDLAFPGPSGGPLRRRSASSRFAALVKRHGLPTLSPHGCRHTAATLLLESGVHPKIVSELLGHSSVSVTLDTYSHVGEGLKRAAAERLDAFLSDNSAAKHCS
jgi:integrase